MKIGGISLWKKKKPKQEDTKSLNTGYRSLDLPLNVFISALVDQDYTGIADFEAIYFEYCEAIGGDELVRQLEKNIHIAELESNVAVGTSGLKLLNIPTLSEDRYQFVIDTLQAVYPSGLQGAEYIRYVDGQVRSEMVDIQILRNQVKNVDGSKPYTRQYFADLCSGIMVGLKVNIPEDMNTRVFCSMVNRYKEYIKDVEKMNNK